MKPFEVEVAEQIRDIADQIAAGEIGFCGTFPVKLQSGRFYTVRVELGESYLVWRAEWYA